VLLMVKSSYRQLFKELSRSYSRLRPGIFVNRPVRTRMPGGVGRGREKLPLTRLSFYKDS
jgi:hypothetical protein